MSTSVGSPSMGVKILLVGGALLLFVMVCWIAWVIMQPEEPETQPERELEPAAESGPDSSLVRAAPSAAAGGQQARREPADAARQRLRKSLMDFVLVGFFILRILQFFFSMCRFLSPTPPDPVGGYCLKPPCYGPDSESKVCDEPTCEVPRTPGENFRGGQ